MTETELIRGICVHTLSMPQLLQEGGDRRAGKSLEEYQRLPASPFPFYLYLFTIFKKKILFFIFTVAINAVMIVQAAWAVTVSAT